MSTTGKPLRTLFRLAALFALAAVVGAAVPDAFMLRSPATLLLMAYAVALMRYVSAHVIDRETRAWLTAVAGMICLWMLLRGAKYIAFEETETVARRIWYLYYLPALAIAQFSLFAACAVARRDGRRTSRAVYLTALVTLALFLLVLTNDSHQLVFRFREGFADWDSDYRRGVLFPAVVLWIALELAALLALLFHTCRLSASRRLIWVPLIPVLFGAVYLVLYAAGRWPRLNGGLLGEFPEAVCFAMGGVWLCLMRIGLIPSNEAYGGLFEASALAAQIADSAEHVIYRSAGAAELTRSQRGAEESVLDGGNIRVHRKRVSGGFVYWQDDVTELNRVNDALRELGERLAEEAELLRLENELKEERALLEAKTRVYDAIAADVSPQTARIAALCAEAERCPELLVRDLREVCLLAAFVKRYANLSLLAADRPALPAEELWLALAESLRQLQAMGIPALLSGAAPDADYAARSLLRAYALLETALEQTLPALQGVQAALRGDTLRAALEGAALSLPESAEASVTVEDGCSYLRISLRKAGEDA